MSKKLIKWHDINKKNPKKNGIVWVRRLVNDKEIIELSMYLKDDNPNELSNVTHWTELKKPKYEEV